MSSHATSPDRSASVSRSVCPTCQRPHKQPRSITAAKARHPVTEFKERMTYRQPPRLRVESSL